MIPTRTSYLLAVDPDDYLRCIELRDRHGEDADFTFPTVMAIRDGHDLVGFLGTRPSDEAVIAGPLVVADRSRVIAMRLIEAYEHVLRQAGVRSYLFTVLNGTPWAESVARSGVAEPYHRTPERTWYRRHLS
jgi:hypothetical protein